MILLAKFSYDLDIMPLINNLWNENIVNNAVNNKGVYLEQKLGIEAKDAFFYDKKGAKHQSENHQQDFIYVFIHDSKDLQTAKTLLDIFLCDLNEGIKTKNSYSLIGSSANFVSLQFKKTPFTLAFIGLAFLVASLTHLNADFVLNNLGFSLNNFIKLDFFNTSLAMQTSWQVWRYFTPSFIHLDFYMLIFASFWFFIIALNIEKALQKRFVWLLFLNLFILNIINFAFFKEILTGFYPLFHSLLTFAFVQNNFIYKKPVYLVPNVLFFFIMVFLVLGLADISGFFGDKTFSFINATGALVGGILASFKFLSAKNLRKIEEELDLNK